MFQAAASGLLELHPKTVGLAAGRTPMDLYRQIVAHAGKEFLETHFFHLDEFVGHDDKRPPSFAHQLTQVLIEPLKIKGENWHRLSGTTDDPKAECERYEIQIKRCGGLDLQILGLGTNGHLAFNEPGTAFDSATHLVQLTEETRRQNQGMFQDTEVPKMTLTMGLGSILKAKKIWLFVTQPEKLNVLRQSLFAKPNTLIPASCLQSHPDTTLWTTLEISAAR